MFFLQGLQADYSSIQSLQSAENSSMQGFHVVEAPPVEDAEAAVPSPFDENEGVDQGAGEEEDFMFLGVPQGTLSVFIRYLILLH
jgi:hypothetical protein